MPDAPRLLPVPGAQRPDRVTLWPVSVEGYRADVTFRGLGAQVGAHHLEHRLRGERLRTDVRQDSDGAWTVRVGPAEGSRLLVALRDVVR